MREGDLSLYTSSLQHALKALNIRWEQTQESWQDNVARKFGDEYIEPVPPQVDAALKAIREGLDHRLLNEIEELGIPTLENLARYIYVRAKAALPEVVRVKLRRPSYNQTCTYGD